MTMSPKTDVTSHLILCNADLSHFHHNGRLRVIETDGRIHLLLKSGHFHFSTKHIWQFIFSGKCLISVTTELDIRFFRNLDMAYFHQNRRGNSPFAGILCAPLPPKQTWKFTFFWDPVCLISSQTDVEIPVFSNADMPHFHQNRFGDPFLLKSGHTPFPSKLTWKFAFSAMRTWSISITTDLEIQIFRNPGMPHFHQNRRGNSPFSGIWCAQTSLQTHLEIHICWNPVCPIFIKTDLEIHFFWHHACLIPIKTHVDIQLQNRTSIKNVMSDLNKKNVTTGLKKIIIHLMSGLKGGKKEKKGLKFRMNPGWLRVARRLRG